MKTNILWLLLIGAIGLTMAIGFNYYQKNMIKMTIVPQDYVITDKIQVVGLFPKTVSELNHLVASTKARALKEVNEIIAIPNDQRTFENTARALDHAGSVHFSVPNSAIATLSYVTKDDVLRDAINKAKVELSHFAVDVFGQNVDLYKAFKAYVEGNAKKENLTSEQQYFLQESMKGFKKAGLHLPAEKREKISKMLKELSILSVDFDKNINADLRSIEVTREELAGLDEDFINGLERTKDDKYILKTEYPIYFPIMEHCSVSQTRKRLYHEFLNRAYPANIEVLNKIIALRNEFAKELGYESYAAFNIDDEMVESPARARSFLNDLIEKAKIKELQEFEQLKADLAPSVELVDGNKMQPWDGAYAKQWFKKKHYQLDDREVANYFPMEKTIPGLLGIYEKFFNLDLKETPITGLWDDEVKLVEVYKKGDTKTLGYLLLDLYPRPHKYSHACQISIVSASKDNEGYKPAVALVIANFPKSTAAKPSVLQLNDVRTFFHEFGHAIHTLLGATEMPGFSGTNVKTDFVEMPSQMLEEWLWDPQILKQMSSHYKTGEQLSDELINKVLELKNFSSGSWVLLQSLYALMSLDYYAPGNEKDIIGIMQTHQKNLLPNIRFYEENHMPASFGHLTGYGARYYGYLWSKVFALDLFNHIKKHGLLNPDIGQEYAQKVLAKGGSKDPNDLLKDFLGRDPNSKAFFKDLGL
ncbi:MAG: M3 family metallopeptidase [Candidatus Babeliales bacterium]